MPFAPPLLIRNSWRSTSTMRLTRKPRVHNGSRCIHLADLAGRRTLRTPLSISPATNPHGSAALRSRAMVGIARSRYIPPLPHTPVLLKSLGYGDTFPQVLYFSETYGRDTLPLSLLFSVP